MFRFLVLAVVLCSAGCQQGEPVDPYKGYCDGHRRAMKEHDAGEFKEEAATLWRTRGRLEALVDEGAKEGDFTNCRPCNEILQELFKK